MAADSEEEFHISDLVKLVTDRSFIYITFYVSRFMRQFSVYSVCADMLVNKFGFTYDLPTDGSGDIFLLEAKLWATPVFMSRSFVRDFFTAVPRILNQKRQIHHYGGCFRCFVLFLVP